MRWALPWLAAAAWSCATPAPAPEPIPPPSAAAPPAAPELDLPVSIVETPVSGARVRGEPDLEPPSSDPPAAEVPVASVPPAGEAPSETRPQAGAPPVGSPPAPRDPDGEPRAEPTSGEVPAGEAAPQEGEDPWAAARTAVLERLEQYYASFSRRDWPAVSEHFWPGATVVEVVHGEQDVQPRVVSTPVQTYIERVQRIDQGANGAASGGQFQSRMVDSRVHLAGDLAHVWSRYEAISSEPGERARWYSFDAFTLLEVEGAWKIASLVLTEYKEHE